MVLDFLIDLNYLKAPAIKNITFPVHFGTLNGQNHTWPKPDWFWGFLFFSFQHIRSMTWLTAEVHELKSWRRMKDREYTGKRWKNLLQQLRFRPAFENTSFFSKKFGFHTEHLNAGIIIWNQLSTLYVEKKSFFNSYKVLLFILYKLVCLLNCPPQEKNWEQKALQISMYENYAILKF